MTLTIQSRTLKGFNNEVEVEAMEAMWGKAKARGVRTE